jgi:Telomere length regulation protein
MQSSMENQNLPFSPDRYPSDLAAQWMQSLFDTSEADELTEKYMEEEYDLFTQCIVVVCGALPTYISISQDVLRTCSTTVRPKALIHFVLYHALPMLLFHTSKVYSVNILIETDNTPALTPVDFSIWAGMSMDSSENDRGHVHTASAPHPDVTLYQNIITNIITLPSVLRSVSSNMRPAFDATMPKWILSEYLYFTQLMVGSLSSVMTTDMEMQFFPSVILFRTLVRHLLRRRQGYYVAASLYSFYSKNSLSQVSLPTTTTNPNPPSLGQRLLELLFSSEKARMLPCGGIPHLDDATSLTGSEAAILYRSVLRYVLSTKREIITTGFKDKIVGVGNEDGSEDWKYLSILVEFCHPLIQRFHLEICHLFVLSSSSVDRNCILDCRLLHVLVLHLSMTMRATENERDDTNDVSDDGDDASLDAAVSKLALDLEVPKACVESSNHMPPFLLYHCLCDIASTWSQLTFVLQTEDGLQRHVTSFLGAGLSTLIRYHERTQRKLDDGAIDQPILFYTTLSMELLEGITARLGSMNVAIRRDGMEIGEQVAALLGQPSLKFEELHGETSEETIVEGVPAILDRSNDSDVDHDEDSDWEEDSALADGYDVEDDRLDLLTTPRPLYLSECLDYLRTPETDESIANRHETVLQHLSSLVRARPADLVDSSAELARSVLRLENKYNIREFSTLVAESLCSLVVEDPLTVGTNLIAELFEDGSLRDRLTILHALDRGAYELSGMNQPEAETQVNGLGLPYVHP